MDDLKQSVQNAAYEQKDPLLIYKFESFQLFKTMNDDVNKHVTSLLVKGHIHGAEQIPVQRAQAPRKLDMSKFALSISDVPSALRGMTVDSNGEGNNERPKIVQPIRVEKKVGRNDPCPCGSGKKFKSCHGVNAS
jgi:preprotein translocase subunit SecA